MLAFLVPLKSPEAAKDWHRLSQLAVRSLRSMCAQTSSDFRVILVCNRKPEGLFEHQNLTVIEEDFTVPADNHQARMVDKFHKLQRAMIEARPLSPCHILFADADDCVSRKLASTSAAEPEANGWYFKRGYIYDEGSRFIYRKNDFDLFCGTSVIARCRPEEMPQSMEQPQENFFFLTHGHPILRDSMTQRGTAVRALPFRGAVYITGSGENNSGMHYGNLKSRRLALKRLFTGQPVTESVRQEFCLYPL